MQIIYGGSFNPPTIAHYEIAKTLLARFPEAEFSFLPANNFYEKDNLKDFHYRLEMLKILCEHLGARAKINDFELSLDRYYGTWYTLQHFPGSYFVIGADNLQTIENWINYPQVVLENKFIVLPRNRIDLASIFQSNEVLRNNKQNFLLIDDFPELDVSASAYRLTQDDSLLLPEVAKYIKEHNLYKE
jgi:nicotinate-nucleotide adenylyltransferase